MTKLAVFIGALLFSPAAFAVLTTNNWTSATSGNWGTGSFWSQGVPVSTDSINIITNGTTKTITVNSSTASSTMTISNLLIRGPSGTLNTLAITNVGSSPVFRILNSLSISNGSAILVDGSVLRVDGVSRGSNIINAALTVQNGGVVTSATVTAIGAGVGSTGTVTVTGSGSAWESTGVLLVGHSTGSNVLTIGDSSSVFTTNLFVGFLPGSDGNRVNVSGGSLIVMNAAGSSLLDVRRGTLTFNDGTINVDKLLLTNGSACSMIFNGGTLISSGTFVTNTQQFAVGDGTDTATFTLDGGVHSFGNGLRILASSFLTGCGTINGNVLVDAGATVQADCGGTLTFSGVVTNNGYLSALNGTIVNFLGNVVNNGTLDYGSGDLRFSGSLQNTGTIINAATNIWVNGSSGKWETGVNWFPSQPPSPTPLLTLIINANTKTVTIDATTVASNGLNGCMTVGALTVAGRNSTSNTLLLSGAGQATPLTVQQSLIIDTNGAVVINNSAMSAPNSDADLFFDVLVGNRGGNASLIVSNGGTLFSAVAEVGAGDTGANNVKNNNVLITGTNSVWNNLYDLYVGYGSGSWDNSLIISNGGTMFSGFSAIGHANASSNNSVLVTGTGSVWNVSDDLAVGSYLGSSNTLAISAGGAVFSYVGFVGGAGFGGPTSNNLVLVTGSSSVWSNQSDLQMGNEGSRNSLVISNGGAVFDDNAYVGNSFSTNNTVAVSGSGSLWENNSGLTVGLYSSSNVLAITGGSVIASYAFIGQSDANFLGLASNNVIRVDSGSLLVTSPDGSGTLVVSPYGGNDSLILNGGSVTVDCLVATNGLNSTVTLNGGTFSPSSAYVTNGQPFVIGASTNSATYVAFFGNHSFGSNLVVRQGALVLNNGTVTATRLLLTNGATSSMVFTSGMLQTSGTAVTNTQQFAVGNGTNAAIYHLLGGVHSFANSLRIRNSAFLTGCGTITSPVLIDTGATVQADCGGTLSFTSIVTNNGAFSAVNGTTVNFFGAVVNNGTINGIDGLIHFLSTVQNNGTIITNIPPSTTDSWASATSGKWEAVANWSRGAAPSIADPADVITNAGSKTVTIDVTTVLTNAINGCMIISNLTVSAPGVATNTLFLSNAGTITPLFLRQQLVIDTNGAVLVNHSALLATNNAFSNILVGNLGANATLTITNNAAVYGGSAQLGVSAPSKNNVVWVSGSSWQNAGNLSIGGLSGTTNTLNIGSGGSVVASNVYVGFGTLSVGNAINVSAGGNLYVTNSLGTGALDVRRGALTFNGGSVTVDSFVATNGANSVVNLGQGALNTKATAVTNTQELVVGDGSDTAIYHLLGGVHSFANDLHITANAILSGCGTINGSVLVDNGGTVQADCGGTLTFSGTVTNNGDLDAINGTTVNFLGPVVNNGTVTATNGIVQFFSTLENNGTLNTNPPPVAATNSWTSGTDGKWETDANWSQGTAPSLADLADVILNVGSKAVTIDGTTSGSFPGTLVISNLTVVGSLPDTNTLLLTDAGTDTPLSVLQQLIIDTNGAVVVDNSSVLANNDISSVIVVGNTGPNASLTISNGSAVSSSAAQVGVIASSSNNIALVAGSGSIWQTSGELDLGYAGSSNVLTVTDSGAVLASDMVVGVSAGSSQNLLSISGGSLAVTNDVGDGTLDVRSGTVALNSGTVTVDQLVLTNGVNSVIRFGGGLLNSADTFVSNGQVFVVGDGADAATLALAPGGLGFHQFNDGLVVTNNATLLGNGTIIGSATVRGTWSPGFSIGMITTSNDLALSSATINYDLGITGGNPTGDLTAVNGNLTLGGTLNITDAGGFSNATYTLFTYTGTLTYNGVSIGTTPSASFTYTVSTNTSGQVNLIVSTACSVGAAGSISGSSSVASGTNGVSYSISSVSGATTYVWTVPTGAAIASGQGGTSISVSFSCSAVSGNVTVTPSNGSCSGASNSLPVTVTGVDAAGSIGGLSSLCAGSNGVAYSISSVNGATSYNWTAPADASIASGQGTTSITVNWGATSGLVTVSPANANDCTGTVATLPVTVTPLPTAFDVTGGGSYCLGGGGLPIGLDGSQSGVNYQLLLNGNATGSPMAGTGNALSFVNQTQVGNYTVSAVNATAGCATVMAGSATLTLSDPFPCWQLQYFGCTNCPQAAPTADPDGDGQNNMAEFLAGTIPTNSSSVLRIRSLVRSGADLAVTWSTAGGHTNILQAANGGANGGFNTNNFVDIVASQTIVGGSGDAITNYLDLAGATNTPSRFYRIRLVP